MMPAWTLSLLLACAPEKTPPPTGWHFTPLSFEDYPPNVTDLLALGDHLLAADKSGQVSAYAWSGQLQGRFSLPTFDAEDCGLISLAAAPDFDQTGLLWYGTCASTTRSGVYRARLDTDAWATSDHVEIIAAEDPTVENPWHNVGWIGFDPSGALLALFGEKTNSRNAQDLSTPLGKVVRVLPSTAPGVGGFTIPTDNPLPDNASGEIYASGLRSPWTGALDPANNLWVADVGSNEDGDEEINLVPPGANLGWPLHEGACDDTPDACAAFTDPVTSWPHSGTHRYLSEDPDADLTILRVGWVASGPSGDPDFYQGLLSDRLLFGDTCLGFVRALQATASPDAPREDTFLAHLDGAAAWAENPDGAMLASTLGGCISSTDHGSRIYRLDYTPEDG